MSEKIVSVDRALDLHKSTVHRTLATLEDKGFVHQNKENERYWVKV